LGTAVFSGMIGVTLFGLFLTPVFFFALLWLGRRDQAHTTPPPQADGASVQRGVEASQRVPAAH
jgi:multidrug efflux pump